MNAEEILRAALRIPNSHERAKYLDDVCGANADLHERVRQLLQARHESETQPTLDAKPPTTGDFDTHPAEAEGTAIGRYKCLQKVGEGAMGVVFMAEQVEPVRRRVALKIIKPGMDSEQVLARFEAERQALALMNHDHIARVFDAGTTDGGRPYFVMELVKGVPITNYCNDNHLTVPQRLELFIAVCHAVQHAHQKGVIHRDLKPSNVLVTLEDERAVPKIIDFGLAKATHHPLTERTMFTTFGAILGTLEYMSPEQADMNALDIDTRTDVYALGVLLYELLTGTTPLAHARLRERGYSEVVRLIREVEPSRPSTQLSQWGKRLEFISAQRNSDPAALRKLVRGDLDWITMKALDKNRARRYQTANELAADVERYLKHEPIAARPPSIRYQLQKFFRRNRAAVLAVGMFVLLLLVSVVVSTWLAIRAIAAETEAKTAAAQAKADKERAEAAEKKAQEKANEAQTSEAIAKAVNDFLRQDVLAQANPLNQAENQKPDPDLALRTVLDRAAAKIPGRFPDQPLVEAGIRKTIGETYLELGLYNKAEQHLEAAVELYRKHRGETHPDTIDALSKLGATYWQLDKHAADEEIRKKLLVYYRRELGEHHRQTLGTLNDLGVSYQEQKKYDLAEPTLLEAYEGRRKYLGEEDPDTLNSLNCLGYFYFYGVQRYDQAEPYYVKALALRRKKLPENHPHLQHSVHSLAMLYSALGRYEDAEPLYQEALAIARKSFGEEGTETLFAMWDYGKFLAERGRFAEAEPMLRKALEASRRSPGETSGMGRGALRELAVCLLLKGDKEEALTLARRYHSIHLALKIDDPVPAANARDLLGAALIANGLYEEAETELAKGVAVYEKRAPDSWLRFSLAARLGEALLLQQKFAEAEPHLLRGYEGLTKHAAEIPAPKKDRIRKSGEQIVRLYEKWGKPEKAKDWRERIDVRK
jgi:serine/threonine protein kinase/Tfp pilus assembly protein PilF